MRAKNRWIFLVLGVATCMLVLDRLSKQWVIENIELFGAWAPISALAPYFRIIHTTNTGAAFGLFRGGALLFIIVRTLAVIAILIYSYRLVHPSRLIYIGLGLILSGAVGNLWDGLAFGAVIDFLDFRINDRWYWPTFNVADSCVVVGVILVLFTLWRSERQAIVAGNVAS